jgi:hypothetical protein
VNRVRLGTGDARGLESLSIVLATDNTTVVAYLKNQGGTHCCALYQLAKDVLILCSQFQIRLVVPDKV